MLSLDVARPCNSNSSSTKHHFSRGICYSIDSMLCTHLYLSCKLLTHRKFKARGPWLWVRCLYESTGRAESLLCHGVGWWCRLFPCKDSVFLLVRFCLTAVPPAVDASEWGGRSTSVIHKPPYRGSDCCAPPYSNWCLRRRAFLAAVVYLSVSLSPTIINVGELSRRIPVKGPECLYLTWQLSTPRDRLLSWYTWRTHGIPNDVFSVFTFPFRKKKSFWHFCYMPTVYQISIFRLLYPE